MNLRADNSSVKHFTLCAARNGPAPTTGWNFGSHSYDVSILKCFGLPSISSGFKKRSMLRETFHPNRKPCNFSACDNVYAHYFEAYVFVCFCFSGLNGGLLLILIVYVSLQIFQYAIFLFSEKSSLFNTS